MSASLLVKHSLSKPRVERLIIFLGSRNGDSLAGKSNAVVDASRGAVASRVAEELLHNSRPSPSDIHDPDKTRLHARDDKGNPRAFYQAYTQAQATSGKHPRRRQGGGGRSALGGSGRLRSPQTWDSARVVDFMGRWCDRLLLGDHQQPYRCAIFEPRVPAALEGETVLRVAQGLHRQLSREHVLLVTACAELPFGVLRQDRVSLDGNGNGDGDGARASRMGGASSGFTSLPDALRVFPTHLPTAPPHAPPTAPPSCSSLLIGVGDAAGPREGFSAEEERRLRQALIPLAAFGCALWATNPVRCEAYLREHTPTPQHLGAHNAKLHLWQRMQSAMLSTRDAALLHAHFHNELLDARLSPQQQTYLAETLLRRLEEQDRRQA